MRLLGDGNDVDVFRRRHRGRGIIRCLRCVCNVVSIAGCPAVQRWRGGRFVGWYPRGICNAVHVAVFGQVEMLGQSVHHDSSRFFGGAALFLGLKQCLAQTLVLTRGRFGDSVYHALPFVIINNGFVTEVDKGQAPSVGRLGGEFGVTGCPLPGGTVSRQRTEGGWARWPVLLLRR